MFSRAHGAISNVGFVSVLLTGLTTVIMLVLPKEPQFPTAEDLTIVYDYSIIYRSLLIACCALFLLIGLLVYLTNYIMEPVYAKQIRKIRT
ncbi:hypothetical protein ScPMuIL_008192 [Solemya velum]